MVPTVRRYLATTARTRTNYPDVWVGWQQLAVCTAMDGNGARVEQSAAYQDHAFS